MNILRIKSLSTKIGIAPSSIHRMVALDLEGFPKPIRLSPRVMGWDEAEIDEWLEMKKNERHIL